MVRSVRLLSFAGGLGLLALAAPASAQVAATTRACIADFEEAQRAQVAGELLSAKGKAESCAAATCPREVVSECTTLLADLDRAVPSLVVSARHGDDDLVDVEVFVDGASRAAQIDGRPIELDPGSHVVRLVPRDAALGPRERTIVLTTGEKNRPFVVAYDDPNAVGPESASSGMGYAPGVVVTSLGAAGLVAGAITGALALSTSADLDDRCPDVKSCPPDARPDIDRMHALGTASTVSFIAGGVVAGAGIVLLVVGAVSGEEVPVKATAEGVSIAF